MKPQDIRYKRPVFRKYKGVEFIYVSFYIKPFSERKWVNIISSEVKRDYIEVRQLRLFA